VIRLDQEGRFTPLPIDAPWIVLFSVLGILSILSLSVGAAHLSGTEVIRGLLYGDGIAGIIVRDIRLPRLLLSLMVGAALGLSGAAMQGLLRNPLAEPAVFGAPQAAAFAAVIVLYSGFANVYSLLLPLAAIGGALLSVTLILIVAGSSADLVTLLLAGLGWRVWLLQQRRSRSICRRTLLP
jgi:iron complex transport system permease protein